MINITLPDGQVKQYEQGISGIEIAKSISISLAKSSLAITVNGVQQDLSLPLTQDATISIIIPSSPEGLEIIRHDAAHILAEAVKELYPEVQVTIGPAIENGFYYDFAKDTPFSEDELETIEAKMREITKRNEPIVREEWDRDDAVKFFRDMGEEYKAEIIASIPSNEPLTLYRQGEFIDLCRGPHAPSTGHVKHFKLMKVAGAYWRGDSKNEMLQRIYGTAWSSKQELADYLHMLEEAEKRDHRKLGKELDLFHLQEEAQGSPFWHAAGWSIYTTIEKYIRRKLTEDGYSEVKTPILVDRALWEESGHWEKFRENMFTSDADDKTLALKPMNCPCHVQIFKQGIKSYRDLPLRMAEFGACHRYEPSGALHGLMRVRSFVQDDAHIFCTEDQITSETVRFCRLLTEMYNDFGFTDILIKFSDRPDIRAGSDDIWDKAERALKDATNKAGYEYALNPGEGAFYGPKLEFVLKDAIGREWQCGTLQVDFVLPERLDASYVAPGGERKRPVMLHRAIIGSFERFIGILIEQHAGKFPLWLAPIQVAITTITNEVDDYASMLHTKLIKAGLRSELDFSAEKINYKIRALSARKIPLIAVLGKKEVEENKIALRFFGSNEQKIVTIDELVSMVQAENKKYLG